jgi:hypothetical protein
VFFADALVSKQAKDGTTITRNISLYLGIAPFLLLDHHPPRQNKNTPSNELNPIDKTEKESPH